MSVGNPARIPVVIGCGQLNDRPATGAEGLDSLELMIAAARLAGDDAGEGVLARTDWLGVVNQISFPALTGSLVDGLTESLGIAPDHARETPSPTGDSPILLINEAANAIGEGKARVALIVGAEALRTAAMRKKEAVVSGEKPKGPYPRREPVEPEPRHQYGLSTPTDVYPLFENAARSAWGQSLEEAQTESGTIWEGMSRIAANTPSAWIDTARIATEIIEPGADNRPIAFPYTKFQVANAAVNQGAAVIVTSLAVAREAGIPEDRLVYVGKGAAAHEDEDPLQRPDYARSASMEVSLRRAMELNGLGLADMDHLELYSCFPVVPKMARRVIGANADRTMTVFGGLTFGGGPIGNYMTHAAACMVEKLRESGTNGLLFANGGYATHNHTILLTKTPQPEGTFPQEFDYQAEADTLRGVSPAMRLDYEGAGSLETYTVLFDREGQPRHAVVVASIDEATRTLATVEPDDADAIGLLLSGDPTLVGRGGTVEKCGNHNRWRFD